MSEWISLEIPMPFEGEIVLVYASPNGSFPFKVAQWHHKRWRDPVTDETIYNVCAWLRIPDISGMWEQHKAKASNESNPD